MLRVLLLAVVGVLLSSLFLYAGLDTPTKVSPQGCRMSYMTPSYILQTGLNSSKSSLAERYSLWLYRETGWDSQDELLGLPVLFIPGNAGSSRQVRSIASSAARQYYTTPSFVSPHFSDRHLKPLDFFAVEFNEDLSAFHGPTLEAERRYTSAAIDYILSLYPPSTQIIIMGHSMGGIVGLSLLPSDKISVIFTMSTPHSVPPARFDSRMDIIYSAALAHAPQDTTPIVSLCGGITDTMIPSEFCVLPKPVVENPAYRRTLFSSALEGCWTGVGHREMVWCHQVRWRIARAALELGEAQDSFSRGRVLDKWLRDGLHETSQSRDDESNTLSLGSAEIEIFAKPMPLTLKSPLAKELVYAMPVPEELGMRFTMYLSGGSIPPISPANPTSLIAQVYACQNSDSNALDSSSCRIIESGSLKLIPNPLPHKEFPVPHEGVGEADGVVLYSVNLKDLKVSNATWITVQIRNGDGRGWITAQFESSTPLLVLTTRSVPFYKIVSMLVASSKLITEIYVPSILTNSLIIHRVLPELANCKDPLLSPMLLHNSGESEGHYYRLQQGHPILLHSHTYAPFLPLPGYHNAPQNRGLNITIYSSGECKIRRLHVTVDWWSTLGRWGARYWNAVLAWGAGVLGLVFYSALSKWDAGAPMSSPGQELGAFVKNLWKGAVVSFVVALIPLPSNLYLGNSGESLFAPMAPLLLVISTGLVCFTSLILFAALFVYGRIASKSIVATLKGDAPVQHRKGVVSIMLVSVLVFLVIPWQVAFVTCYLLHFHVCATELKAASLEQQDSQNQKLHILLLMTWCLPILAPVLAVWVRTLLTAGFTTPFDGDHFVLNAIAFMYLTYIMSSAQGRVLLRRHRLEYISVAHVYAMGSAVIFLLGPRSMYRTYEALNWPTIALICFRALPKLRR